MEPALHRKILLVSLIVGIISVAGAVIGILLKFFESIVFAFLFGYSLLAIVSSYTIKYQGLSWARKGAKYSLLLIPFFVFAVVYLTLTADLTAVVWILISVLILLTILTLIHLFLYTNSISLTATIVLLIFSVVGIFFKRNHWPLAGTIIVCSSFLMSAGSFMFGIRCLYLAEKNSYFRNVTFLGSFALSVAFLGQLFKMQHWAGAGGLLIVGFAGLILGTLYILLTLHSSGFIDWQPLYKKIFRRILIPWIFIFLLYISRFMVPELNTLIFSPGSAVKTQKLISPYGFGMKDYSIEDKTEPNPK